MISTDNVWKYNRQGENSVSEIAFFKMGEVVFGAEM